MNFDFSDDLKQLRDQARRFLTEQCPPAVVRRSLDEGTITYTKASRVLGVKARSVEPLLSMGGAR